MSIEQIEDKINTISSIDNNSPYKYSLPKQYDDLFKLVIIGNSGVGKSCLLFKICR